MTMFPVNIPETPLALMVSTKPPPPSTIGLLAPTTSLPGIVVVWIPPPRTIVLLFVTLTPEPIATELNTCVETSGFPANHPMKTLLLPVVFNKPAAKPRNVFDDPVVLSLPAEVPKNEFCDPDLISRPAPTPKKELESPLVSCAPASSPTRMLFNPGLLKTRTPAMLYCVMALKTLAVPEPARLKFAAG